MKHRVVITGIGVVSPIGTGKDAYWQGLSTGRNGIHPIEGFDTTGYKATLAAEIRDFAPENYMEKKEARRMDRFCQMGMASAELCVQDSGMDMAKLSAEERARFAVLFGSGVGGFWTMESNHAALMEGGPRKVSPFMVPMIISNIAPGRVAIRYGLHGPAHNITTACASATDAIGYGLRMLRDGYGDRALCGGAEACITPMTVAGFTNMTALSNSTDPNRASIPFDAERNGFIMGEGGGTVMLETLEAARARGAKIYAEVLGYGVNCDAYHITAPSPDGAFAAAAMTMAMEEAGVRPEQVDYINAHGTSTPPNDVMETKAIKAAFGEGAKQVSISSTKSMHGHMLGAAGAVEAIACLLAMENGFVPPTINLDVPDEECDLDYTAKVGRERDIEYALSNSFGFGGHNSCICIGRFRD